MKRRFPVILSILLGVGLLGVLLAGGSILGRNTNRIARNNTTQQGRNITGTDMNGPSPIPGPDARNIIQNNQKVGIGNNSPYIVNIGRTPSPNNTNNINNNINNNNNNNNNNNVNNIDNTNGINNLRLNREGEQLGYNAQKADNICKQVDNLNGIDKVNAVVAGNTALIGYDSAKKNDDIASTKNLISTKVKQLDNTITNVVITDSKDINSRIGNLAGHIKNKKPLSQLNSEFNQIMQSLNPSGKLLTQ
ncbi:YhcN/YlaJ family sporulation lipoprotein [Pseudobacteroides cellulosolvens]|uniref:Sporulation lipoprotein YhcN/YlaJ-like protein n=1 Tax=Pseudobacteroides cellulosolvens ATCC 35603 = DSM 2933 TaxID=398512 RepID=A0A0L6JUN7_9FIRM|nr:YhcN/YlaJ family sporulation lipoprotein [Pseudobacteroides cellulosolvens]KNY29360.1 Sporulation lipoprotein YhcN/YlaJ-like protein [Pseudobacteroides cellulosolvens ATCC 35603 = DSM 2933]